MKSNLKKICAAPLALSLFAITPAMAEMGVAVQAGSGSDGDIASVALITNKDFWAHSFASGWSARAHIESNLTRISGKGVTGKDLWVVGVTPVVRFEPKSSPGFLELGIGANYFDKKQLNESKSVGTHFEFGDIFGVGFKFGSKQEHEFGYRFIHYSNAGISANNPGIDFHLLRFKSSF